jgi:hypothetical protein
LAIVKTLNDPQGIYARLLFNLRIDWHTLTVKLRCDGRFLNSHLRFPASQILD